MLANKSKIKKVSKDKIDEIVALLSKHIKSKLVSDLLKGFADIKQDIILNTLGGGSPGKFVETVVQIMQYLETRNYDKKPAVDKYLRNIEDRTTSLSDSFKLVVSRVARSIYSLRNKRGIAHKGEVNPNMMDLKYIFAGCRWILAEIIRIFSAKDPDKVEKLIEYISITPSVVIEDFGEFRTVLNHKLKAADELLTLLHYYYPNYVPVNQIYKDMKRRVKKTVGGAIGALYKKIWIDGSKKDGYKLTTSGYTEASSLMRKITEI